MVVFLTERRCGTGVGRVSWREHFAEVGGGRGPPVAPSEDLGGFALRAHDSPEAEVRVVGPKFVEGLSVILSDGAGADEGDVHGGEWRGAWG